MSIIEANLDILRSLVYGGAVLGCGGGGKIEDGLARGQLALSRGVVRIADINEFDPNDMIVTVSSVGSPKSATRYIEPEYYIRSLQVFEKHSGEKIRGVITCENGAAGSVNGWLHASSSPDLFVVDAPANGHAHPTGLMGAMGLHRDHGYVSKQSSVGGNPALRQYSEIYAEGSLDSCSNLARRAADLAGGVVAVVRNPVPAKFVRKNAAIGGLSYAISIGRAMLDAGKSPISIVESAAKVAGGTVLAKGKIEKSVLWTENAFDYGSFQILEDGKAYIISFMNEYMTLDLHGTRIATFPDLIMVFDAATGRPLPSSQIADDQEVYLIMVPHDNMPLGKSMYCSELFDTVEEKLHVQMKQYLPKEKQ